VPGKRQTWLLISVTNLHNWYVAQSR